MTNTYIYTLSDPRTGDVCYVGKSDNPSARLRTHMRKERTKKSHWIQSLVINGMLPEMDVVDCVPVGEWQFWEQHWIQLFRSWGFPLKNGDNGGLGPTRLDSEVKNKISSSLLGKTSPSKWKKVSAYCVDGSLFKLFDSVGDASKFAGVATGNISKAAKTEGLCAGLQWRYADGSEISASIPPYEKTTRVISDENRSRLFAANFGRKASIETREKQRLARLGVSPANKGVSCSAERRQEIRNASTCSRPVFGVKSNGFIVQEWSSVKHASEETGASRSAIAKVIAGKYRHAANFVFMEAA